MTEPMDGIIVVDKPSGWTSHDVVNKLRRLANTRKVGHLGTLDPMATGVLPLVIGRATRLAQFYTHSDKTYDARVRFGFSTNTYDAEGTATSMPCELALDAEELERHLDAFRGEFLLRPPPVSAKKIRGVPAYKLARQNVEVELKPVPVQVHELTLVTIEGSEARLLARCSAGTYLRSIAHELGQSVRCGAHLSALRRVRSGDFSIEQARTLEELEALAARRPVGRSADFRGRPAAGVPIGGRRSGDRRPGSARPRFSCVAVSRGAGNTICEGAIGRR